MTSRAASFGDLLRRLRVAVALSQEELAERAGLSARGISDLERGVHQAPRPETLRLLADALALSEGDREALVAAAHPEKQETTETGRTGGMAPLPVPATPLLGREHDRAEVSALLSREEVRLVTLTGLGGAGKTHLAIEVARHLRQAFPDGVAFVDLAPLSDPALVIPTIATALGIREASRQPLLRTLVAAIHAQHMLLLLDNCEQVLASTPEIAELIASCPDLTILATSRESLKLRAEREWPLAPLPLPNLERLPPLPELEASPAVALFAARAAASDPRFSLTAANALAVATVCHRVDGLPLAIELAAARVKHLSPAELASRLESRLPLLTGGARDAPARQRTLRAALAWSYDLLSPDEQALFRHLGVFVGGWTIEAAEAVANPQGEGAVIDGLTSLIDKSLVWLDHSHPEPRYRMLETVREFAWDELQRAGEVDRFRTRHAAWVRAIADQMASAFMHGPVTSYWPTRIAPEIDNIRAALTWLDETGDVDALLSLTGALWGFWRFGGYRPDGRRWVTRALELPGGQDARPRMAALLCAATMAEDLHENDEASALAREALILAEQHGDFVDHGISLVVLSLMANARGAYEESEQLVNLAMTKFDERRHPDWIAGLTQIGAIAAYGRGDVDQAEMRFAESLRRHREIGETWLTARALDGLARVALHRADSKQAALFLTESLPLHREFPTKESTIAWLTPVASLAVVTGEMTNAARLLGAGVALREKLDLDLPYPDRAEAEAATAAARSALGDSVCAAAWEAGRALSIEDAVRLGERMLAGIGATS